MLKQKKRLMLVLVASLTFTPMAFGGETKPSDFNGPSIRCTEKDKILAEDYSGSLKSKSDSKEIVAPAAQ